MLSEMYERMHRQRIKAQNKYWKKAKSRDLPCKNAKYVNLEGFIVKGKTIRCKLTDRGCVCSYYSELRGGSVMNGNFEDCPGYQERKREGIK